MSELFSTDLVPAPDRLEAWRSYASLICGNSRFQFPRPYQFQGVIDRRMLGPLQISQFSSAPVSFAKYPSVSANAGDRGCIIISQLKGIREYCQNGSRVTLKPGDTTLIDGGRPWSSTCASHCSRLYLRLPRWLLEEKLRVKELPVVHRISGESGLGATLFRLGTSLYHEAGVLSLEEGIAAMEAYLHILSACIGLPECQDVIHGPAPAERIARFIEEHLADPELAPPQVAAAAGISVRHLHRLFLRKGITVTEWIRQKRLDNCRAELADAGSLDRNITEIAFSWGFSDSAHFSHLFKKQFGVSPRDFRCKLLNGYMGSAQGRRLSAGLKERVGRPN